MPRWLVILLVLYAGAGTLLAGFMAYNPTAEERLRRKLNLPTYTYSAYQTVLSNHYENRLQLWTERPILFLGDSHIQYFDTSIISDHIMNLGVGGLTSNLLREHLRAYEINDAQILVIGIGINDLMRLGSVQAQHNIRALIKDLQRRDETWFMMEVMPVNEALVSSTQNAEIVKFNALIEKLCVAPCRKLAVYDQLLGPSGQLDQDYDSGDGLHLNREGYVVLSNTIQSALGVKRD